MNIFVGSLSFNVKDDQLKAAFENFGEVSSARVLTDKFTGRSKGFGFVDMPDNAAAQKAIDALNGTELEGRAMVVNEARERTEDSRRPSTGGYQKRDNSDFKKRY
ncbi:MAG: RNA-binding protein [Bacteroidales bacterium]|nr:RNA-binding protein [Paludibacteraceae bacterium]NLK91843.1 RNA-binding protein [Bacteroidales bacterium]